MSLGCFSGIVPCHSFTKEAAVRIMTFFLIGMILTFAVHAQTIEQMRTKRKTVALLKTKLYPEEFVKEVESWIGTPYRAGSNKKKIGTDNVGFVTAFYNNNFDVTLEPTPGEIWESRNGRRIGFNEEDLDLGDVMFWSTQSNGVIDHVAIYLDYEYGMIHVTSDGVVETPVENFHGTCIGVKRYIEMPQHFLLRATAEIVATNTPVKTLQQEVDSWVGTPYVWGAAKKKSGSDCSGFVTAVYQNLFGISLPRCSYQIWEEAIGKKVGANIDNLLAGDVLFFSEGQRVTHVAIYMGDKKMIHAKNPQETLGYDPLTMGYYMKRFVGAKRFVSFQGTASAAATAKEKTGTASKTDEKAKAVSGGDFQDNIVQSSYSTDQPGVSQVVATDNGRSLSIIWFFNGGHQERAEAVLNEEADYLGELASTDPDAKYYTFYYTWQSQKYRGTIIASDEQTYMSEINENRNTGDIDSYKWTRVSKKVKDKTTAEAKSGKTAAPIVKQVNYQTGSASYYADKYHGRLTANEEVFDMYAYTAAHRTLPFGTILKVTHLGNNRSIKVRINDRGPFIKGRIIDLSLAGAKKLDMLTTGVADVQLDIFEPTEHEDPKDETTAVAATVKTEKTKSETAETKSDNDKVEIYNFQTGKASFYGEEFHGKLTANEEVFDMNGLTAAHRTLPFGAILKVTNLKNKRSVQVKVNDRGPFAAGKILELSLGAAKKLDMVNDGGAKVRIDIVKLD